MVYVYILLSERYPKTYTGSTVDLENRIKGHNSGKSVFTKRFKPWKLVHYEEFETLSEARLREKYFKSHAGRKFLKKLLDNDPR